MQKQIVRGLKISNFKGYLPFILLIAVIFLLRLPSFFEPHWYFDEGVYSLFGKSIVLGKIPYVYIWDHKPLGIYLIYAFASLLPFGVLLEAKILAFLSAVASSFLLFLIAKQAFPTKIAYFAAFLFAIFSSLPFFDGNQANGEIFLLTPALLAIYLIEPFSKKVDTKKLFFAGLAIGIAISIKQVTAVYLGLGVLLLFIKEWRFSRNLVFFLSGAAIPLLLLTLIAVLLGTPLSTFWFSVVSFNLSYIVGRKLGIAFNFLKVFLLVVLVVLFIKKRKIAYFPLFLWLVADSLGVLSGGQPYPHYLIEILPVSSLILAITAFRKNSTRLIDAFSIAVASFFIFMFLNSFFRVVSYGDVFREWSYYPAFLKTAFARDSSSFNSVFSERWGVARNKKVVVYLNQTSGKNDAVYIWGGGTAAWLYYDLNRGLPSRYVSFLHIEAIPGADEEVLNSLESSKPHFIITTPHPVFLKLENLIDKKYQKAKTIEDTTIYHLK